jgi:glycosyltransferase involved in cell wall biosynthesis
MNRRLEGRRVPVSVVIPALNEERYLPCLLRSLLSCAHREMDIIVVDGKSEDRTVDVATALEAVAPPWVSLRVISCPVRNVSYQRNLGAAEARHETLMFLDADVVVPTATRLEELLDRFHRGGYAAVSCRFEPLERDPRAILYYRALYLFHKTLERWNPYALGACILTTRRVFRACRGFDPTIRVNEDAHFCQSASRLGRFAVLPVAIGISTRRFVKYGYLRMGFEYVWIFLNRTFRGEARDDRIRYEFGNYE